MELERVNHNLPAQQGGSNIGPFVGRCVLPRVREEDQELGSLSSWRSRLGTSPAIPAGDWAIVLIRSGGRLGRAGDFFPTKRIKYGRHNGVDHVGAPALTQSPCI